MIRGLCSFFVYLEENIIQRFVPGNETIADHTTIVRNNLKNRLADAWNLYCMYRRISYANMMCRYLWKPLCNVWKNIST